MTKYILALFSILIWCSSHGQTTGISFSGSADDMVQHIAADSSGNYYVYLTFSNQLTLDSAGTPKKFSTTSSEASCIVKYNCTNTFQWAVIIENSKRVALNGGLKTHQDAVFVAFSFPVTTAITFSDGSKINLNASGAMASCLMCLSNEGILRWKNILSSNSGTTEINDIYIAGNGSLYLAGGYKGVLNMAGQHGTGLNSQPSIGSTDAFLSKLNVGGDALWLTNGGGNGDDYATSITGDLNGNVYAAHIFSGNASFGAFNVSTVAQWGSAWARLNQTDGSYTWVNATTAPSGTGGGIVTDDAGYVYFLGSFQGIKTFPSKNSGYNPTISAVGGYDLYIAKYKSDGNLCWVKKYGGTGDEYAKRATIRNNQIFANLNYDASFSSGSFNFPHAGQEDDALLSIDSTGTISNAIYITGSGSKKSASVAFSNTGRLFIGGTYNGSAGVGAVNINSTSAYDGYIFIIDSLPAVRLIQNRIQTVCNRKSVQIFTGPDRGTFEWSPGYYFSDSAASDPILIAPQPGKYFLKYTSSGGCIYFDTLTVNITFCTIACTDCDSTKDINKKILFCLPLSGTANDESNHGYDGIGHNLVSAMDRYGRNGYAYSFNGTNSYINITKPIPDLTTATLSLWIKSGANTTGAYGKMIVWEGNNNCNNNYFLSIKDSTLYFGASKQGKQLNGTAGNGLVALSSSLGNNWNHLVWVLEPTQSNIYLNGVLLTTINKTGSLSGNHFDFTIGAMNDGGGGSCGSALTNFYNGLIDDVRLYNQALNANEVSYLYDPLDTITVGADLTICKGDSAYLGVPPAGHKWKYSVLSGDMGSLLFPNKVKPTMSSAYLLKDTTNTCTRYDTIFVTVKTIPGMNAGNDTTICEGDTIELHATGPSAPSWTPISGISDPNILNPKVYPSNSTPYVLSMTGNGCTVQDTLYITVDHKPVTNLGGQLAICKKDSIMLQAPAGYQYTWTPFRKITNPRIYNPIAFPDSNITYYLTLTSGVCTLKDSVKIIVQNSLPTKTVVKTICLGDSFQMVSAGASIYQWSPGATLNDSTISNPNCSPAINTRYFCKKISSSGCEGTDTFYISVDPSIIIPNATPDTTVCAGQKLQLSASGGVNYIWSPGNLVNDSTLPNPIGVFESPASLVVAVTGAKGCTRYDTVQIAVNPISITACPDPVACNKTDSIQLWAVGCDSYIWSPNIGLDHDTIPDPKLLPAGVNNIYIVTGKVANGCTRSDTVLIRFTTVKADAGPDMDVCGSDSVKLQGSGGFSYQWVPTAGLSDPTIPDPMAYPPSDGYYMLIATDSFGCSDPDSVYLTLKPKAMVYTDSLHIICRGQEIPLMASGDGSYEWSTGNLDSIIYVNPQRDTFYYVLSKPAGYCPSDTVYTKIYVNPMPKAGFKARPEWGFKPMKVQFFDESRAAIQYRWYFGNGDTDTIASPAYIYNTHGHYMVRQLVTNQYNCTDSASFEIVVFDSFYMYIPNTFTPNNNKKNDLLLLDYDPENMLQGNIQIFNRWGEMVYEADLKNYIPWDGNFHGKPVPSDAYVLVWYVTDLSRGEHHNAMILHVFR